MATLKDIAERAGVSVKTASNVLNGKNREVWPSTIERAERIRSIAKELGYRPNAAARAIRTQKTNQVGVFYLGREGDNRIQYLELFEVIEGISHVLEEAQYSTTLVRLNEAHLKGRQASRALVESMFEGTVCVGHVMDRYVEMVEELAPQSVMVENNLWRDHGSIRRDEQYSGKVSAEHLIKTGVKRILCINRITGRATNRHFSWQERLDGIQNAAWEHDIPFRHEMIDYSYPWEQFASFMPFITPETGVICVDSSMAIGLHRWCADHTPNQLPGRDFPIACACDDVQTKRLWPELSRMSFDRYHLGRHAAEMLLMQMDEKAIPAVSQKIRSQWISGQTCFDIAAQSND